MKKMQLAIALLLSLLSKLVVAETSPRRVFHGKSVSINKFPYLIQIASKEKNDTIFKCGGAIIGRNLVLTAGHCFVKGNFTAEKYVVRSGASLKNGDGAKIHNVTNLVEHESYHSEGRNHDIAVVQVEPPFTFGATRKQIPISITAPRTGDRAVLAGWGAVSRNGSRKATVLQAAKVPIKSQEDCIQETSWGEKVQEGNFCAGGTAVSRKGDSGSPLTVRGKIVGLTSWGRSYYKKGYPGVVVNVPYYEDWIRRVVDDLGETDVKFQ